MHVFHECTRFVTTLATSPYPATTGIGGHSSLSTVSPPSSSSTVISIGNPTQRIMPTHPQHSFVGHCLSAYLERQCELPCILLTAQAVAPAASHDWYTSDWISHWPKSERTHHPFSSTSMFVACLRRVSHQHQMWYINKSTHPMQCPTSMQVYHPLDNLYKPQWIYMHCYLVFRHHRPTTKLAHEKPQFLPHCTHNGNMLRWLSCTSKRQMPLMTHFLPILWWWQWVSANDRGTCLKRTNFSCSNNLVSVCTSQCPSNDHNDTPYNHPV